MSCLSDMANASPPALAASPKPWLAAGVSTVSTHSSQARLFTPVMVSSLLNSGSAGQWPNRIGSGKVDNPTIQRWFNPADFVSPATIRSETRAETYSSGLEQNSSTYPYSRSSTSRENAARHFQFRAEAFNVLNTPQFNNPNAQIGNPAAGTITSAGSPLLYQRTSRQIQLALKLYF